MAQKAKKKNINTRPAAKRKKVNPLPFVALGAAIICVVVVVLLSGNSKGDSKIIAISQGESLTLSKAEITSTASFFPISVDGMQMEVLAVRDSAGRIRTAFNTCQVCYDSGRGYYVQSGADLVCQNCGNHFSVDEIEVESGGCNPWPIFPENKTETDEAISISYDFLVQAKSIFAKWKGTY